jgi:nickel superoxide dismutase
MTNIRRILTVLLLISVPQGAAAHCEIPCGVYDDGARFTSILEHATTIEKSMLAINDLSAQDKPDLHAIIRWTTNKEKHAQNIQDIAAQYFLTQRVKSPKADAGEDEQRVYAAHTTMLQKILEAAMKTKQSTDVERVEVLRAAAEAYKEHYFNKHGHKH